MLNEDNQAVAKIADHPHNHSNTKHFDIAFHFIRELVKNLTVVFRYIRSNLMCADMLTKPLARVKLTDLMVLTGMYMPRPDSTDRRRRPRMGVPRDRLLHGDKIVSA